MGHLQSRSIDYLIFIEKNINIRRNTRKTGITETPFGIKQLH